MSDDSHPNNDEIRNAIFSQKPCSDSSAFHEPTNSTFHTRNNTGVFPGQYVPETDAEGNFILSPFDVLNNKSQRESTRHKKLVRQYEEFVCNIDLEEEDFLRELEIALTGWKDGQSKIKPKEQPHYAPERLMRNYTYFPIHEFNTGLGAAHEHILNFAFSQRNNHKNESNNSLSLLLYGEAGTGKSSFIDFTCNWLIQNNHALIIRIHSKQNLEILVEHITTIHASHLRNQLAVFIVDDLDSIADISNLACLLDTPALRHNSLFLITSDKTTNISLVLTEKPGRVAIIEEVRCKYHYGFKEAWYHYLTGTQLDPSETNSAWYKANLCPVYLKELFLISQLRNISVQQAFEEHLPE